jgi:hypothetical protein
VGRFSGKTIRGAFKSAAFFTFVVGLLSCGPEDQVPSNSGASQNSSAAVKSLVRTVPDQNAPPPSPEVERILSRHALYLSDLKYPASGLDPQEQEVRTQRVEYLNRILIEPDPETREILINWSKTILENDPEANQIINELKVYDGDYPDTDAYPFQGSFDSPVLNTTAGETGG